MNDEGLKREVGVTDLALSIVNFSIGGGVYVLPALIGIQLGPASLFGYVLFGLMFAAIVLCYVEIGSRVKSTGGSYAYVEAAFGPFAGYIVNWLFFFGWSMLSDAAVMNIAVDSLAILFPSLSEPPMRILMIACIVGLMILVNVRKVKTGTRVVSIITMIKMLPLLAIIVFGWSQFHQENMRHGNWPSLTSFNETALILFFIFAGFETSLNISGEIKDPKRTIPRSVLLGGIIVFIIYLFIQLLTLGILGNQMAVYKDAPLAAIAEKIIGPAGAILILIATVVSALGGINGDILTTPRLLFAGAKDGLFPKYLGKIHPRFATPHLAVITYGILIFIFSISGGFKQLAVLASGALLLIYLSVVLSVIRMRTKKDESIDQSFRIPGGLTVPLFAITGIVYVLTNLSRLEIFSITAFVAAVCLIYFVTKTIRRREANI